MYVRYLCVFLLLIFFFKQKTAYEMRISDWSSDVCSSDLNAIAYQVDIDGVEGELNDLLRASSELLTLQENPPLTLARLRSRAEGDVATFERVLRSRGYYDAKLDFDIDDSVPPADIDIAIAPGEPYTIERYTIEYVAGTAAGVPPEPAECGIQPQPERKRAG